MTPPAAAFVAALGLVVLLGACTRNPEPAMPDHMDTLDAAVAALIRAQLTVVRESPRDGDAHGELGLIYAANDLWRPARDAFVVAASLDDDTAWHFHAAVASEHIGETDEALRRFEALTGRASDFAPAYERLGDLRLALGAVADAETAYRRVIALAPDSPEGYAGLGAALLAGDDAQGAVAVLIQALERDAAHRSAHHVLGNAYRRLGRPDDAVRHLTLGTPATKTYLAAPYDDRLLAYRVNLTARIEQGVQLMMTGRLDEAVAVFRETLQHHPRHVTLLNNLAIALMRQNRLDESRAMLDRALAVDDSKFPTYLNLASWALRARDPDLALRYAQAATERAPDRFQPWFLQGRILLSMDRYEAAADAFGTATQLEHRRVDAHVLLGESLLRMQRWATAREAYESALQLDYTNLRAHAGMVRAGLGGGDLEMTARHLEILKRATPDHPEVIAYQEQLDAAIR